MIHIRLRFLPLHGHAPSFRPGKLIVNLALPSFSVSKEISASYVLPVRSE